MREYYAFIINNEHEIKDVLRKLIDNQFLCHHFYRTTQHHYSARNVFQNQFQGTLGNSQSLFYPDYVVKLNDGTVWIIETKGGQKGKQDQNIDIKVLSKFYAFKDYAEKNKINWGFVRPMNGELYLNNTEYTKNIEDSRWVNLNNFF